MFLLIRWLTFWRRRFISINNQYVYLCHDDDYWVKIYLKDLSCYKGVIEQKIRQVFMGRKKSLAPLPEALLDRLYTLAKKGMIFDFENCTVSTPYSGVTIYPARAIPLSYDLIHKELDYQRNLTGLSHYLEYNSKTKKWSMS